MWSIVLPDQLYWPGSLTWLSPDLFSVSYPGGLFRIVDTDGVTVYEATDLSLESLYPAGTDVNVRNLRPVPSSIPGHVVFLRDKAFEDSVDFDLATGSSTPLDWAPMPPGSVLSHRIAFDGLAASIGPSMVRVITLSPVSE